MFFFHVTHARYLDDYRVEVSFSDGKRGVADLKDALKGPMFAPLREKSLFSALTVDEELETIAWPNGADLAPEYLYFQAFKNESALQEQFKQWGYLT
ncbi:MAG: DUF2442 domain-containing protein [Gammaproteobacteria bacterium]|nr:DUF2442 domain-containing protein [Gammaproteobacteria bacterium]MDE0513476.1 DUF2442 domain-containing protein [Gammaproteobacteria bacterium]